MDVVTKRCFLRLNREEEKRSREYMRRLIAWSREPRRPGEAEQLRLEAKAWEQYANEFRANADAYERELRQAGERTTDRRQRRLAATAPARKAPERTTSTDDRQMKPYRVA